MTTIVMPGTDTHATVMPGASSVTTLDGTIVGGTITGITAHTWVADQAGLFTTATNLAAEWANDYTRMLEGMGGALTALQRMEGNAEAVVDNTAAGHMQAARLSAFREDAQREFDAIYSAMQIDQTKFGIDPTEQFNTYTYQRMEHTLQGSEQLVELAVQGHGLNDMPNSRYVGYTETFQNGTDNRTFYVGGGPGNGETAIAGFFDDGVLTHAPFPAVMHNGVMDQLNQNGSRESTLADAVAGANATAFTRVFVASDSARTSTQPGPWSWCRAPMPPPPSQSPAQGRRRPWTAA